MGVPSSPGLPKAQWMTVKNAYPLPDPDILNKVSKAKARYFTKLVTGVQQHTDQRGDEWKATFQMKRGLFEPLVMLFSLTNSLATFQMMMNDILERTHRRRVMTVYMDDILIFGGQMKEQHHTS